MVRPVRIVSNRSPRASAIFNMSDTAEDLKVDGAAGDTPTRDSQKRRIVEAAAGVVEDEGLTLSLDHLNFETIVKQAGVPRSTAYRLWPDGRDGFRRDVLIELSGPRSFGSDALNEETVALATDLIAEQISELDTPEGRRKALTETVRVAADHNFVAITERINWRVGLAVTTTNSLASGDPDDHLLLAQALKDTEEQFIDQMVEFFEDVAVVLGVEMNEGLTFTDLVCVGASVIEGLAIRHLVVPEKLAGDRFRPGEDEPWSLAAIGYLSVIDGMTHFIDDYDPATALQEYVRRVSLRRN